MMFLRSKLIFAFIFLMSAACLTSMIIAVQTTITVVGKKDMAVKIDAVQNKDKAAIKYLGTGEIAGIPLYFNGVKAEGFEAFLADKKQFLFPIDAILKKIGLKYSYYDSDDILQTVMNGKKVLLNLGMDKFSMGNKEIAISAAPLAYSDHILVPQDMIANIAGFSLEGFLDKKAAFINYFPEYLDKTDERINLIKTQNGMVNISDIEAKKTNNIEVDREASLTNDGKYLYWTDLNKRTSYLYEIAGKKTIELGDYYFKIQDALNNSSIGTILSDYSVGGNYKRITFTDKDHSGYYTFLERNGKPLIDGPSKYSPDGKELLCYKNGKCYLLNADGTGLTPIGEIYGKEFEWISSSKIFMNDLENNKMFVITKKGKSTSIINEKWNKVGRASNGDVFYTKGNSLYAESNGVEKKILDMPWALDYVYGTSSLDPIIAVSRENDDGVFYINNGKIIEVTKASLLLNSYMEGIANTQFERGITSAPDGKSVVLFQSEDEFLTLTNINIKSGIQKKVVLDYSLKNRVDIDKVKSKWITADRLLVFNEQGGWIIDFKNDVKIYCWTEVKGSNIKDANISAVP